MAEYEIFISRLESGPLDRFKNQNLLLKKFGEDGLKVYNSLEQTTQAKALMEATGMGEDKFVTILEFMEENGIISVSDKQPEGPAVQKAGREITEQPEEEPEMPKPRQARKRVEEKEEEPAGGMIKPIGIEPEGMEEPDNGQEPDESEQEDQKEQMNDQAEEIVPEPQEDETPQEHGEGQEPEEQQAQASPEEEPSSPGMEGQGEVQPIHDDEEKKESEPKPSREEEAAREKLSPIERIIFNKYGNTGVLVYKLIDGEKTAEEIMLETGLSEVKLVEILEFLESQGIIKLEKPQAQEPVQQESQAPAPQIAGEAGSPGVEAAGQQAPQRQEDSGPEPSFRPMIDEKESIEAPPGVALFPDIIPIDVPMPAPLNPISSASVKADLFLKFKGAGLQVYSLLDGKRDVIKIALEAKLSLSEVDQVLAMLGGKKAVYFKPMSRDEIKAAYGEDALAVYKKFGREGVMIYDLIGKEPSLRDIVVRSRVEAHHAVEILLFIHSILGVDMPLNREVLYKQLGIS